MHLADSITEVEKVLKRVQRWAAEHGVTLLWSPLADQQGGGYWSSICLQMAALRRLPVTTVVEELNGLLQSCAVQDFVVTSGGGLEFRPAAVSFELNGWLLGNFKDQVSNSDSLNVWCAAPVSDDLQCSSLRLFSLALVQNRLARALGFAVADERLCTSNESELAGLCREYLNIRFSEWGSFAFHTRYLWSQSFERNYYQELKASDPNANYIILNQEWLLPISREVQLEEFVKLQCVSQLVLHLASPWLGRELVPWCACFQEEANLMWSLSSLLERLAMGGFDDADQALPKFLGLRGELGQLHHLLLCHEQRRYYAVLKGEVAGYLDSLRSIIRLSHRFLREYGYLKALIQPLLQEEQRLLV